MPADVCVNKVNKAEPEGELEGFRPSIYIYLQSVYFSSRNKSDSVSSLFLDAIVFLITVASCRVPHLRRLL